MVKQHNKFRLHKENIGKTLKYHTDYHYKPVWDGTEKGLAEIEAFRVEMDIPKDKTFVMPAGDNRETLVKMYPLVFEMCAEHGYNMTGRDHIIAYDIRRAV
jgi:7-carboxy-7-deazaguanine synthase